MIIGIFLYFSCKNCGILVIDNLNIYEWRKIMNTTYEHKELFDKELNVKFKGNDSTTFPDFHFHDYYEIYYCISGGNQYLIDDTIYSMETGDLFIINDFEIHKPLRDPNGDYRRIVTILNSEKIKEISPKQATSLLSCFTSRKGGSHNKIHLNEAQREIFVAITTKINDISLDDFGAEALIEAYFIELLVFVNRWYLENYTLNKIDESFGFNSTVKSIIDYTNDNFTSNITLDSLVDEFHLNKHYMCQIFKQTTGTTIHRYIISRRLARAKILLNQGYNVTLTSDMCGFQNYTNFIRTFKNNFGLSPKQFAKRNH